MIVKCQCGVSYNNCTVGQCPLCEGPVFEKLPDDIVAKLSKTARRRYNQKIAQAGEVMKQEMLTETERFLKEDRSIKNKIVSSYRRSSLAVWQTQHRNPGKPQQFRGAH